MTKKIIACIVIILMAGPALQHSFHFISSKGLNGYTGASSRVILSDSTWLSGKYQDWRTVWANDSIGFKSDFVRLYNQIDFSVFGIPHAHKIILGKDDHLFGEQYINAYLGRDYIGTGYITYYVNQIKTVQDWLEKKKQIHLVVLFTPSKGWYYADKIPQRFLDKKKNLTNLDWYVYRCKESGVNYIDMNSWFLKAKDSAKYILYPKTGIHWSTYGAVMAADSLRKYLERKFGMKVPKLCIDSIPLCAKARNDDNDIEKSMNLIWSMNYPPLAYPVYHSTHDSLNPKPRALFVGDSFYWQWYYPGIIANYFSNTDFWYYNKDVYPETFNSYKSTSDLNYMDAVLSQNVIVLIQTNAAYGNVGYGFIQEVYNTITKK